MKCNTFLIEYKNELNLYNSKKKDIANFYEEL
jgi:hypothetical protein